MGALRLTQPLSAAVVALDVACEGAVGGPVVPRVLGISIVLAGFHSWAIAGCEVLHGWAGYGAGAGSCRPGSVSWRCV